MGFCSFDGVEFVSTHSRTEAAAYKQITCFFFLIVFQHTAARRRLLLLVFPFLTFAFVSTHSRTEAAAKS